MKETRYLNCLFFAKLLPSKKVGAWVLQIRNNGHNHMLPSISTHPSHHQAQVNAHIESIPSQLAIGTVSDKVNDRFLLFL